MAKLAIALYILLLLATVVVARPYRVDDMLRSEGLHNLLISPDGRWLVFERQVAFEDAARFRFNAMAVQRARLYRVDLRHPGKAQPLVPLEPGVATAAYGFSPDGRAFAFGRLQGETWRLGVATLATGAVRWFDLAPDYDPFRPTLAWVSNHQLVMIASQDQSLPWLLAIDSQATTDLPRLWRAQQAGTAPTVTAVGSGRARGLTPRAPSTRLMLVNVSTGTTRTLGGGDLRSLSVSADGRYVALIENGELIAARPDAPMAGGADQRVRRLTVVEIATGKTWRPCPACDPILAPPIWSPRGARLLVFARTAAQPWSQGRIFAAEPARATWAPLDTSVLRPVVLGYPLTSASAAMAWLGDTPLLFAHGATDAGRADWYRLDGKRPVSLTDAVPGPTPDWVRTGDTLAMIGAHAAWRIDRRGARRLGIVADRVEGLARSDAHAGGTARQIALTRAQTHGTAIQIQDGARGRHVFRTVAASGRIQPVGLGGNGRSLIFTEAGAAGLERIKVQVGTSPAVAVAAINGQLADVDLARPIALHHCSSDGVPMTSWLYVPVHPRHAPLPLIVLPYGGHVFGQDPPSPDGSGIDLGTSSLLALVGHGYAVLLPSMPAIQASVQGSLDFAGQILPAVDAAIATGLVDPRRLGLWGHSFGAYNVAMTLTQTDRFAAALVANGIYDIASGIGSFTPWTRLDPGRGQSIYSMAGWAETGQPGLAATPWAKPEAYVANSILYRAGRIRTPLLIVAADQDVGPLGQGELLFSALYRQDKDAELLSYWGENHVLTSPANIRDVYDRAFRWFDAHFADAAMPAPSIAWARDSCSPGSDRSTRAPSVRPAAPAPVRHNDRCA